MILSRLDDMKAEETVTIDLRGKSAFSDYMIVTSGQLKLHNGSTVLIDNSVTPTADAAPTVPLDR